MRYVCIAKERVILPWAHIDALPGQEVETDRDLSSNPNFIRVNTKPAKPAIRED